MTMPKAARAFLLLALIGTTLGCDRITKHIARTSLAGAPIRSLFGDSVRLEYAENTGGFLSIGTNLEPQYRAAIFTIGTGLILIFVLLTAIRLRGHRWHFVGACLAFAGGASNLADRMLHGSVVDFMNVGVGEHFRTGIFNVADVAIFLGIFLLMFPLSQRAAANARNVSE